MSLSKNIFAIIGSASKNSANEKLIDILSERIGAEFVIKKSTDLKALPHFDPQLSINNPPQIIMEFRKGIEKADAVIICTPEYVFSIPSGLKNAIEWCVATTVFSDKAAGLITAAANGEKAHEELKLIMKTIMAKFTEETTLLIQGIKGKINESGEIKDGKTEEDLVKFIDGFKRLLNNE